MDFELVPFKEIQDEITLQTNPRLAFRNILQAARKNCPALDWDQFPVDFIDPAIISSDCAFACDAYGANHLIQGLYSFFANFSGSDDENKYLAEYVIFLSYSGLVLREALLKAVIEGDFISCWGFHDGDLFLLLNRIAGRVSFLSDKE